MASKVESICTEKVVPQIEQLGYYVLEVNYSKKVDGQNLTFVIDKDGGVLIEDCEKVHRMLDTLLDEINPTDDAPYILNVESAGLDRPIKTQRDFLRNKGKEVEVKLYKKLDGKKSFVGNLMEFDDTKVVLSLENQIQTFAREDVALISPVIKF